MPVHVVVGILQKENKVLMNERPKEKPYGGYWEFPGGKVEQNELPQAALRRELHEELGILVESSEKWFEHIHAYTDKVVLLDIWRVTAYAGEPHGKEQQILRWVSVQEMLTLRMLQGNWPIVEKIKSS